ncbi:type II secretion system F family protein [Yersinia massiliensis]|uniref:Pilus assembly protein PilR n=1 Tax=Yersinia massiliensis TaxID=419257 RepID=A0ABM6V0S4_9GAMM|nr:type II secretion system F family protein [Yersinia massiliensis]AVX40722.1 pilus assembly protein PilR [Yersinia massiliensis]
MNKFNRALYKMTFNVNDREDIYDNFRQYLVDGQSIDKTFKNMIVNYTRRGKNPNSPMADILREWEEKFKLGLTLGESLRGWIPEQELSVIDACDAAGRPWDGFQKATKIARSAERIKKTIKGAFFTSIYMFLLSFVLLAFACSLLVPTLLEAVPLFRWSTTQKFVYYFYMFISGYWWALIAVCLIVGYLIYHSLDRWTGNSRFHADKFVPYSLYKEMHGATFIINVDAMLSAGIPLKDSLIKIRNMSDSDWLIERVNGAISGLTDGEENLGLALDISNFEFPSEDAIIKMQSLFETANKEGSLERFGERQLENTISRVERKTAVIKVASMIFGAGCTVGIFFVMYSLIQQVFNI